MTTRTDVAIIGAGPYGLSIAAHLNARKVDCVICGTPMSSWSQMPEGMLLKSDGFASNLYDLDGSFSLKQYCHELNIPYNDIGYPVELSTFISYGHAFQKRFVPEIVTSWVERLTLCASGFQLHLECGDVILARRVVIAVGVSYYAHIPKALSKLPKGIFSHGSEYRRLHIADSSETTVIGRGSSAIDIATILHEHAKKVRVVTRGHAVKFHGKIMLPRSNWDRIRRPLSGIGPGLRSKIFSDAPNLFRYLPKSARIKIVRSHLGPASGWFMKERFAAIPLLVGHDLQKADVVGGRASLEFVSNDGSKLTLQSDHVIAGTGYLVDIHRIAFLSHELKSKLKCVKNAPVLSKYFESSVPGLYFVGPTAATSFGPVMRFAVGAKFTTKQILRSLSRKKLL